MKPALERAASRWGIAAAVAPEGVVRAVGHLEHLVDKSDRVEVRGPKGSYWINGPTHAQAAAIYQLALERAAEFQFRPIPQSPSDPRDAS